MKHPVLGVVARLIAWGLLALVLLGLAERLTFVLAPVAAFRLHLALLAVAVLVPAAMLRAWRVALPAGAAAALAAVTLGPVWQAPERPAAAPGARVTLLFANVRTDNPLPEAAEATLLGLGADIVVLAETPPAMPGGAIDRRYPHAAVDRGLTGRGQTALWSRYPIDGAGTLLHETEAPAAARAVVRLDENVRLVVLGVHFARAHTAMMEEQLDGLASFALGEGLPLVVVGDFNAAPWSALVDEAARRTGTVPAAGFRVTWRGEYPLIGLRAPLGHQIDHLLLSPGIGIAGLRTIRIPGSDHHGLLAELVVPPEGAALSSPAPVPYVHAEAR